MIGNDEAFEALADRRRRQLLVDLLHDDSLLVPQLSGASRDLLAAHESLLGEYLAGPREVDGADKTDVRTYHVHLPMLVEYGYVEWDRDAHLVTRGPAFDDLRPLLEVVDGRPGERRLSGAPVPIRR
ncbi:hypothetical protein ACFQDG_09000 [Natronoarchaeum mannanilyticum]|uniref:DUF7344 domain-containing protein n=1 Tax=Natronoarchaeum mannanilyticum TaxID=926360 RepID=A0AAV3T956_9EURY